MAFILFAYLIQSLSYYPWCYVHQTLTSLLIKVVSAGVGSSVRNHVNPHSWFSPRNICHHEHPLGLVSMHLPHLRNPATSRIFPLTRVFTFFFLVPFLLLRPLLWEIFFSTSSQFSLPEQSVCRSPAWYQMPQSYASSLTR